MSIYEKDGKIFLETQNSIYSMTVYGGKYPVHLYYGSKNGHFDRDFRKQYKSFSPYFEQYGTEYSPDCNLHEFSYFGSGDFRPTALRIKNKNGDSETRFEYVTHRVFDGRIEPKHLPFAEGKDAKTLEIILKDTVSECELSLYYTVFEKEDVISRYMELRNVGDSAVQLEKCMSLMLDLPSYDYDLITLYGAHNNERNYERRPLYHGTQSICSRRGASSHQFNPFISLCSKNATETDGEVFGFNFMYSGNFLDEVDVDQFGFTRVMLGLGSENFTWKLEKGEKFISPEAVMTYSQNGLNKMSQNFHTFIRNRILPPEPFDCRPVVLNSWEACYFNIDEKEMLRFAESVHDAGMDMLVMDDGWFGARNDDKAGLGDWFINAPKFPKGLAHFVDKVKSYGIKFGIWIEPEMVNPDSDLFRAHPDWCLQCKGRELLLSRNQLVLDMSNPDVINYLKDMFSKTFEGVALDYFKWDMNRHMCDVGSPALPADRQGETAYRYMLGVYELYRWFKEKYPNCMIENCSGGGGRYDLGMMKYSNMIWTSDNTDPKSRIRIQFSSTLGYPTSTMSCHVSNRKNICTLPEQLEYRYHIAMNGALGYELHLPNATDEIKATIKEQVKTYKTYEKLILNGDFFRVHNPYETNYYSYYFANADRTEFLVTFVQCFGELPVSVCKMKIPEADKTAIYVDTISGEEYNGKTLFDGISVKTKQQDPYSTMWHFVKK